MEPITITATVARVQTMADGGIRLTFDAPETEIFAAAQLMECKRWGVVGKLTFEQLENQNEVEQIEDAGTIKRTKAKRRKPKSGASVQ